MPDPKKDLTAADAAKLVSRTVVETDDAGKPVMNKDGSPRTRQVPVKASEVLAFRDYGTHVNVVTTGGEKLTNKPAE